ncbi:MAG: YqaA family protein [Plesiomonas sp.]|uniref:YqaA family protein n=1 Tax=Plesiomonas sp. TaxID=2486279 RepID=UPI003F31CA56
MKLFGAIYDRVMIWARHPKAEIWLGAVSFIEAIFFPIPPDIMLAPMALAEPKKAVRYALVTAVTSVLGGIIGYALGYYLFDLLQPMIAHMGYQANLDKAMQWFKEWGVLVVFIAGFSPIPYKVFTVTAGLLKMAFWPFVGAALISRTARFLLVALLMAWGGPRMEVQLRKYIEILGWGTVALAVLVYLIYR